MVQILFIEILRGNETVRDAMYDLFISEATTEGDKDFDKIELDNKDVEAWKLIFNKAGWYEAYSDYVESLGERFWRKGRAMIRGLIGVMDVECVFDVLGHGWVKLIPVW